jgi:hypothetical protein
MPHNCHNGKCDLTKTKILCIERNISSQQAYEVTHNNNKSFILNSASLRNSLEHHRLAQIEFPRITPIQWIDAIHEGLKHWPETVRRKRRRKNAVQSTP